MRVLVYEPKFVGHFLGFGAAAARAFAEAGAEVVLALSKQGRETPQAAIKLGGLPDRVRVDYACDVPKLYKKWVNARVETAALQRLLEEQPTDWLVVPSADFLVSGLLLRPGLRRRLGRLAGCDLVLHNCRQAYPDVGRREWPSVWLDRLAASLCPSGSLHTVDEYAVSESAAGPIAYGRQEAAFLPHFYEAQLGGVDRSAARARLGLAEEGRWVGSVGDLGRRKGTELLIESFARIDPAEGMRLALFGALSETAKETLQRHASLVESGRIVVRDQYVEESVFNDFFLAMDVVWAGYPRQVGMASTMLYAADARRPVVAVDYGGVAWTVRRYGLGVVGRRDPEALARAIREAADRPPPAEGADAFLARNSTAGFNRALTARFRDRLAAKRPERELAT